MTDKLKPCPAGHEATIRRFARKDHVAKYAAICSVDTCGWADINDHDTEEAAIAAWNHRPSEDGLAKRVKEAESKLAELKAQLQWRSTADAERPTDNQRILVWRPYVFHLIAANYDKCTDAYTDDVGNYESFYMASHWMPIPKGPEVSR